MSFFRIFRLTIISGGFIANPGWFQKQSFCALRLAPGKKKKSDTSYPHLGMGPDP